MRASNPSSRVDPHRPAPCATKETLVDGAYPTLIEAVEAWQPDPDCIAAGNNYCLLAARCYAAAGLGDSSIRWRFLRYAGPEIDPPEIERYDAALALARHGTIVGASAPEIVVWLARLALEVPCWPDDPEQIASIALAALREAGQ